MSGTNKKAEYRKRLTDEEAIRLHELAQEVSKYGSVLWKDMSFLELGDAMTELNSFLLSLSLRQKDRPLGKPDCIVCGGKGYVGDMYFDEQLCPCIDDNYE